MKKIAMTLMLALILAAVPAMAQNGDQGGSGSSTDGGGQSTGDGSGGAGSDDSGSDGGSQPEPGEPPIPPVAPL